MLIFNLSYHSSSHILFPRVDLWYLKAEKCLMYYMLIKYIKDQSDTVNVRVLKTLGCIFSFSDI